MGKRLAQSSADLSSSSRTEILVLIECPLCCLLAVCRECFSVYMQRQNTGPEWACVLTVGLDWSGDLGSQVRCGREPLVHPHENPAAGLPLRVHRGDQGVASPIGKAERNTERELRSPRQLSTSLVGGEKLR